MCIIFNYQLVNLLIVPENLLVNLDRILIFFNYLYQYLFIGIKINLSLIEINPCSLYYFYNKSTDFQLGLKRSTIM